MFSEIPLHMFFSSIKAAVSDIKLSHLHVMAFSNKSLSTKSFPEFTKVLEGLWCTDEGKRSVNPDRFYRVFKEALPYFSGYRFVLQQFILILSD